MDNFPEDTVTTHTFGDPKSFVVHLEIADNPRYFIPWARVGFFLSGQLFGMRTDWVRLDDVCSDAVACLRPHHGRRKYLPFQDVASEQVFAHLQQVCLDEPTSNLMWPEDCRPYLINFTQIWLSIFLIDDGKNARILYKDARQDPLLCECGDIVTFEKTLADFIDFIEQFEIDWHLRRNATLH